MIGFILEGIPGSGKTTLLRELVSLAARSARGSIWVATEHITERTLEPFLSARPKQARDLVRRHLGILRELASLEDAGPKGECHPTRKGIPARARNFFEAGDPALPIFEGVSPLFFIERFHLSLSVHIPGLGPSDFTAWEASLSRAGAHLVWLRIPPGKHPGLDHQ